jgi:hypothetical protein
VARITAACASVTQNIAGACERAPCRGNSLYLPKKENAM